MGLDPGSALALILHMTVSVSHNHPEVILHFTPSFLWTLRSFHRPCCLTSKVQIRGMGGGEVSKVQMVEGDQRHRELCCRWAVRKE